MYVVSTRSVLKFRCVFKYKLIGCYRICKLFEFVCCVLIISVFFFALLSTKDTLIITTSADD